VAVAWVSVVFVEGGSKAISAQGEHWVKEQK